MSINPLNDISKVYLEQVAESAVPGKPAEKLGAVTAIPQEERDAARKRALAKAAAIRAKKGIKEATKAKPDYLDFDGDGNTKESMKKALRDKAKQKVQEAKKPNDGNLANNYPPYDKVTRGDIIAGALGQDQMGGKKKKKSVKEGYSNWREELSEVIEVVGKDKNDEKIIEKKVSNKIKINPSIREAVENLGGILLEMEELDEKAYRNLGVGRVERVSSGSYVAPETTGAAAKKKSAAAASKSKPEKPVTAITTVEKPKPKAKPEKPVAVNVEKPQPKEEGRRARRRRKSSPSYPEIKAGIEAREAKKKRRGKKKRTDKLDDLLASIRSEKNESFQLSEKAESEQQQKLFGLALSVKRGQTSRSEVSDAVLKIADGMSEKKIRDFAKTKHEGLPKKVETKEEAIQYALIDRMTKKIAEQAVETPKKTPQQKNISQLNQVLTAKKTVNDAQKKLDQALKTAAQRNLDLQSISS
jgi:hypothetical protein